MFFGRPLSIVALQCPLQCLFDNAVITSPQRVSICPSHFLVSKMISYVSMGSGGARGHPDEGAAFPDGGGAETPRAAAAPPAGYGAKTSGFNAFGQLRIASPATICKICNR